MVREAEVHAAEDTQRRAAIELRNQTDALVYATERQLAEVREALAPDDRRRVEEALEDARKALQTEDAAHVTRARDRLADAGRTLAAAAAARGASSGPSSGAGAPDVVDAEVVDTTEGRR